MIGVFLCPFATVILAHFAKRKIHESNGTLTKTAQAFIYVGYAGVVLFFAIIALWFTTSLFRAKE